MISLQKQVLSHPETPETFMTRFESQIFGLTGSEAQMLYQKLKYLGLNFDPFAQEVTSECKQVMDGLGLTEHLQNPYLATNILLRLLDKTEEQINKLKQ